MVLKSRRVTCSKYEPTSQESSSSGQRNEATCWKFQCGKEIRILSRLQYAIPFLAMRQQLCIACQCLTNKKIHRAIGKGVPRWFLVPVPSAPLLWALWWYLAAADPTSVVDPGLAELWVKPPCYLSCTSKSSKQQVFWDTHSSSSSNQ